MRIHKINNRCCIFGIRDENLISISEYRKLARKRNECTYDRVGTFNQWELCMLHEFNDLNKSNELKQETSPKYKD